MASYYFIYSLRYKMADSKQSSENEAENLKPFLAPCNKLAFSAPLRWLYLGWEDYKRTKLASNIYGSAVVLISYFVFLVSWQYESIILAIAMLSAFIFIAPVLCIGLYSVSRQLQCHNKTTLYKSIGHGFKPYGDLSIFIIVITVISLLWARAASMIHVFFPISTQSEISGMLLFFTIGTAVGSIFASLIFSVSVFSLPMVMDKKVDMITSCVSSINAVLRNKRAMMMWSGLLVLFTGLSILTAFLGFLLVMPILGYATWHGYQETLIVDEWEDRIEEFS